MHSDSGANATNATPKHQNTRFVPFLLVLLCAVALGFGIRYYKSRPGATTGSAWEIYFSELEAVGSSYSLEKRLVDRIGTATVRVDAALYDLDAVPIADAFIEAHTRGVQVRVVTEADNIDGSEIGRLQDVGIPVSNDKDPGSLMHHKFIVIDERYVWTGSYNTTYNGAYKNNNNVILIDSVPVAYNFTQEFRELFSGYRGWKPFWRVCRVSEGDAE